MSRTPSLRLLDGRARYQDDAPELKIKASGPFAVSDGEPTRTQSQIHKVWVHPFEMETGDYFWGGYMSLVTKGDQWSFRYPENTNPNFLATENKNALKKTIIPQKRSPRNGAN